MEYKGEYTMEELDHMADEGVITEERRKELMTEMRCVARTQEEIARIRQHEVLREASKRMRARAFMEIEKPRDHRTTEMRRVAAYEYDYSHSHPCYRSSKGVVAVEVSHV